jgi:hypothetical protein
MCDCDFDPPEFCQVSSPKARKKYRCVECLNTIEPGEQYERTVGKWEGEFSTQRTCFRCVDLRNLLDLDCWVFGNLVDDVSQCDILDHEDVKKFLKDRNENIVLIGH